MFYKEKIKKVASFHCGFERNWTAANPMLQRSALPSELSENFVTLIGLEPITSTLKVSSSTN